MPKNRHRSKPPVQRGSEQNPRENPATKPPFARSAAVFASLAVALAATGILTVDALGLAETPGCGAGGGCDEASQSVFGKVTLGGFEWPVAFLGFAYYVAMLVSAIALRARFNTPYKAIATLGAVASLFYVIIIAANLDDYLCAYCLVSHAANFVFTGVVLFWGVRGQRPLAAVPTMAAIAGSFVLATGAIAGVNAAFAAQDAERIQTQGDEDVQQIIEQAKRTADRNDDQSVATTEDRPPVELVAAGSVETGESHPDLPAMAFRTDDRGFTGRYRLGPKEAKIRIVMFSDYGCKACRIVSEEIKEVLVARDDVSYSHMHFPFDKECNPRLTRTVRPKSCEAARIAEAVGELHGPAAFWRFHFGFYEKIAGGEPFTGLSLIDELGYPGRDTVLHARNSSDPQALVVDDVTRAYALGLTQTPTVYINGVEFRTWGARGNLTRRINQIAEQIPAATAESDTPFGAAEKYVADYELSGRTFPDMGNDTRQNTFGPASAPVEFQLFFGYETDDLAQHLRSFQQILAAYPEDVRMVVRHYAMSERCNMFSERNRRNDSCLMHHALESASILGGNDAFQKAYLWLLDNLDSFDESRVGELADYLGLDAGLFLQTIGADQTEADCFADAAWLHTTPKLRATKPVIFVNNKRVQRWEVGEDRTSVLTEIIRRELEPTP